jgi:5-methylcytosine-specific restriction endonuclease McrA
MAQSWAIQFYKSPAWLRNRKAYLRLPVHRSGHRVYEDDDGGYYWIDEYGSRVMVSGENVVPPGLCERCFDRGEYKPAKVVHHIIWLNSDNINDHHITLSFDNFQRLCQDCHAAVHAGTSESRVTFDECGNVVWKED